MSTTSYVSPEFKRSAASLVLDQSYSHVDASQPVGRRRWVQQLLQERHGITPHSPAMTPEQQSTALKTADVVTAVVLKQSLLVRGAEDLHRSGDAN